MCILAFPPPFRSLAAINSLAIKSVIFVRGSFVRGIFSNPYCCVKRKKERGQSGYTHHGGVINRRLNKFQVTTGSHPPIFYGAYTENRGSRVVADPTRGTKIVIKRVDTKRLLILYGGTSRDVCTQKPTKERSVSIYRRCHDSLYSYSCERRL